MASVTGIFLVLHLLYAWQNERQFELRPGMTWPDGSWALDCSGNPANNMRCRIKKRSDCSSIWRFWSLYGY